MYHCPRFLLYLPRTRTRERQYVVLGVYAHFACTTTREDMNSNITDIIPVLIPPDLR